MASQILATRESLDVAAQQLSSSVVTYLLAFLEAYLVATEQRGNDELVTLARKYNLRKLCRQIDLRIESWWHTVDDDELLFAGAQLAQLRSVEAMQRRTNMTKALESERLLKDAPTPLMIAQIVEGEGEEEVLTHPLCCAIKVAVASNLGGPHCVDGALVRLKAHLKVCTSC